MASVSPSLVLLGRPGVEVAAPCAKRLLPRWKLRQAPGQRGGVMISAGRRPRVGGGVVTPRVTKVVGVEEDD